MTILISQNSGKLWLLIGLISLSIPTLVWVIANCVYHPEDLGRLQVICARTPTNNKHVQTRQVGSLISPSVPKSLPHNRRKRAINSQRTTPQTAITREKGRAIFWYNSSNTHVASYTFDYCNIVPCPTIYGQCSLYIGGAQYICVTDDEWGQECNKWGAVGWNTHRPQDTIGGYAPQGDWGYKPLSAQNKKDKNGKSLLTRMTFLKPGTCLHTGRSGHSMKLSLTIENPSPSDAGTYILGTWKPGLTRGEYGKFQLKDMYKSDEWKSLPSTNLLKTTHVSTFKDMVAIADPTYEETIAMETGFSDTNLWLEWMRYNAQTHNMINCYVCGKARPHLGTVPLNIPEDQEECFLSLYTSKYTNDTLCERWKKEYPIMTKNQNPGSHITIYPGNYTCYESHSSKGKDLKKFPEGYCYEKRNITIVNQTKSLGDIYWICGDMKIRTKLDVPWRGECALAKIIMPLHIMGDPGDDEGQEPLESLRRRKREAPGGSFDPHVYIDAIGVPRGVPDEYKARDQVAAGFESLFLFVTVNKNVDWINYIYYNQQRFVNATRDALQGVAEQLEATSQMTFQNRMSLDMILAEKGGTCVYIGKTEGCCTYIPDNTGPNGKVTLAIKKLENLSDELKKNSGINNPWDQYFGWFTNWKQTLVQLGTIICGVLLVIGLVVCCAIPCFRKLLSKGIENVSMFSSPNPEQQVPLNSPPESYLEYIKTHKKKKINLII